ncbi:hypothetical protein J437_LFUL005303 [Ladona fulva]|uniref:Aminopeptidase P N-terminal domain-containing protein n=1 Tax=Ladona fulva TaxID=123851 RepID=A0A8K0K1L4_LADFU|nr:hypothetical protein J437_LFUL005303 [Ladona fulva]
MDASTKSCDGPCYQMGPHTYPVPMELFARNRERLLERVKQRIPHEKYRGGSYPEKQIIYLQGGEDFHLYCTDVDLEFRQESYFNWLFGVQEPGFSGAIEVQTGVTMLFMPRLPEEYDVWMGKLRTPEDNKKRYGVDLVYYIDERSTSLGTLSDVD